MGALRNSDRLPLLSAYLERLPEGLDSYPDCRAKDAVSRGAVEALPDGVNMSDLPPALSSHFLERRPVSAWIPETISVATYLAIRDAAFDHDAAYLQWVHQVGRAVFSSPMYRILMWVANPRTLAKGSHRRWTAFHRGSAYSSEILASGGTRSRITFPAHLFERIFLLGTLEAILAAYHACGATKASGVLEELGPTHAVLTVDWGQADKP